MPVVVVAAAAAASVAVVVVVVVGLVVVPVRIIIIVFRVLFFCSSFLLIVIIIENKFPAVAKDSERRLQVLDPGYARPQLEERGCDEGRFVHRSSEEQARKMGCHGKRQPCCSEEIKKCLAPAGPCCGWLFGCTADFG